MKIFIFSWDLLILLYILPGLISLIYIMIHFIEDYYYRSEKEKAFKNTDDFYCALFLSLVPIINIRISYIAIKTIL